MPVNLLFTPFVYWKPDEREAEGGEHQPLWEPVEGGREQPPREPVKSSYREEAIKEGTLKHSADKCTSA